MACRSVLAHCFAVPCRRVATATRQAEPKLYQDFVAQLRHTCGIERLGRPDKIALACSGGPDSMALAVLWAQYVRQCLGEKAKPLAVIVDHRLREDAKAEAQRVQEALVTHLGYDAHIMTCTWQSFCEDISSDNTVTAHQVPLSKKMSLARHARYAALLQAGKAHQLRGFLVAHHLDDQIETFYYRLAKNSGVDGLAGMRPRVEHLPIPEGLDTPMALLRPLLPFQKTQLLAVCDRAQVPYVLDPTNQDQRFARNAIRHTLEKIRQEEVLPSPMAYPRMTPYLAFLDRYRTMMSNEVARLTSSMLTVDPDLGTAFLVISPRKDNWFANQHVAVRLLSRLIAWASPSQNPVRFQKVVDLYRKMANAVYHQVEFRPSTTANCIVVAPSFRKSGIWAISREPLSHARRKGQPMPVDQSFVWDNRYRLCLRPTAKEGKSDSEKELAQRLFASYMRQTEGLVAPHVRASTLVSSRFTVSQISQDDVHYLQRARRPIMAPKHHIALKHFLQTIPVISRFTIPGIYWDATTSTGHTIHQLIAMPSLGINLKEAMVHIDCTFMKTLLLQEETTPSE